MNKVVLLWIMLCLAVLSGPLSAGTSDGYSNTFKMDNTAEDKRIRPPTSWSTNPYDNNAGWHLLRGQFHVHSKPDNWQIYDDSGATQWDAVRKYKDQLGYDFLAVTDHNEISIGTMYPLGSSDPWRGWAPHSVEITHGPVPPDAHVLAIGTNTTVFADLDSPSTSPNVPLGVIDRINKVHSRDGLALIAHPSAWPGNPVYYLSVNEVRSVLRSCRPDAISIYQKVSHSEGLWDSVLRSTTSAVWGYTEDDYHPDKLSRGNLGITWTAVPCDPPAVWDVIKQRVKSGNFYSYWVTGGQWPTSWRVPRLRVAVDGSGSHPLIHAQLQDESGNPYSVNWITFIGKGGEHLKSVGGSSSSYQCKGDEVYVRVRIWQSLSGGRTLHIASQPIFVHGKGVRASSVSGVSVFSTSPELILTYLQPADMPPTPPANGFIGPVFDVATADGLVPPGATLDLSYEGEDLSALGGTQYLAVYRYDTVSSTWIKVGGTVNIGEALITTPITELGYYTISADIPEDTASADVFFDNPYCGSVVVTDTEVKVTVNDDLGAYQVGFSMNGHPLGIDTDALDGWSVNLPYADYCTGDWILKAVAEDLAGNRGEAEIPIFIRSDTPRPTVTITSPAAGANLNGTFTAGGTCGDDVAVTAVTLYADDTLVGYGELDEAGTAWTAQVDTSNLADGARKLRAVVEDYPGNAAEATVSGNITNGSVTIGSLKGTADGQSVRLGQATVTAGTAEIGGAFYIQADDRSTGIRIVTDKIVPEGARVGVAGVIGTENGERQITASDVFIASTGNTLPDPLGTVGTSFKAGLKTTGLLVKAWGVITQIGDGYIYVDDGSQAWDGTYTGASKNYGVRVVCDWPDIFDSCQIEVIGISSSFITPEGSVAPRILVRQASDVDGTCSATIGPTP